MRVHPVTAGRATEFEISAWQRCLAAVRGADSPTDPAPCRADLLGRLLDDATRHRVSWLARDSADEVMSAATLAVSRGGNEGLAKVQLEVRPDQRRGGLGRRMLHTVLSRARTYGCRSVYAWVVDGGPAERFARAAGAEPALRSVRGVLRLPKADRLALERLADGGASRTSGYTLVRWVDRCPDDLVDGYARTLAGMNEVPVGTTGLRPLSRDADFVRRDEEYRAGCGDRVHALAAHDDATGEWAGVTVVVVRPDSPRALQGDTTVVPTHRGRGLGLWLKAGMLRWIATEQPHVTEYETFNAEDNRYMIAVNERLGYRTEDRHTFWRLALA